MLKLKGFIVKSLGVLLDKSFAGNFMENVFSKVVQDLQDPESE